MALATAWDNRMVPIWPYVEKDRTNWTVLEKRASTDTEYRQDWTNVGTQSTKMPRINTCGCRQTQNRHKTGTESKKNELSGDDFSRYEKETKNEWNNMK